MIRQSVRLLALAALACGVAAQAGSTPEAAEIARRANDREAGKDMSALVKMSIYAKSGAKKEYGFEMKSLKGAKGEEYSLVTFKEPKEASGVAFLSHADDKGKTQWLYMPATGKASKVAPGDADKAFMGSDLSYDDFGKRDVSSMSATLVSPSDMVDGVECWKIESRSADAKRAYPRIVFWIGKADYVIRKAEFYDKKDKLAKTLRDVKVERIGGYPTMTALVMEGKLTGTRTEVSFSAVKYDSGLSAALFAPENLGK